MIFQYYLPGLAKAHVTLDELRKRGLAMALRDCLTPEDLAEDGKLTLHQVHARGPDGMSGLIVAPHPADGRETEPGFYPDRQTWEKWTDALWIGTSNEHPPTPDTLRREALISGYEMRLGDDQIWQVPTLRRPSGASNLPQTLSKTAAGELQMRIVPSYAAFWGLAGKIWDAFAKNTVDFDAGYDWCVELLALNYRVGRAEVGRLGLVSTENCIPILGAAIDLPLIEEFMGQNFETGSKKNEVSNPPGRASSSPGPPTCSPAMNPAGASSTSAVETSAPPNPSP